VWPWCPGSLTCPVMKPSALRTAFVSMTTPGGAPGVIATWAKVARAAQKVGPLKKGRTWWWVGPMESQRAVF
jgi:hypothetical protein